MSGMILIILGIMGEHLGRIYLEVKRRPLFIIEDVYRSHSHAAIHARERTNDSVVMTASAATATPAATLPTRSERGS